jgi:hypothetical protein
MDLSRMAILAKIHEKRSYILSAIETYMLKSSSSSTLITATSTNTDENSLQRSFVNILRKQQQMRREMLNASSTLSSRTMDKLKGRYGTWDETRLSKLLSLLNDLYRQVLALITEANQIEPSDIDMQVLAAVTGKASTGKINFNLFSTIYTLVFKLV